MMLNIVFVSPCFDKYHASVAAPLVIPDFNILVNFLMIPYSTCLESQSLFVYTFDI